MGDTLAIIADSRGRRGHCIRTILAAIVVIAATACSPDAPAQGDGMPEQGDGPIAVTVATVPVISSAPLFIAQLEGFFAEEGLEVETQIVQGVAATASAVVSGETEFGFAATVPLMIAVSEGVPIRIVANSDNTATTEDEDVSSVAVQADSGIDSILDLQGRTVATNALNNIFDLAVRTRIAQEGGDPAAVQFIEIPLPEMIAALSEGRVEAIALTEPFSTAAEAAGHRLIDRMYYQAFPDTSISGFFASQAYIDTNPDIVARFQRAIDRATTLAQSDPSAVRRALAEFTQIPEDLLDVVRLTTFTSQVDDDGIALLAELLETYDYVNTAPSADELTLR